MEFMTLMASTPELAHFTGEHAMTPYMLFGARGIYSWFINFNPRYVLDWYQDIVDGRWDMAIARQKRMHAFIQAKAILEGAGNFHAIVNKAMSAASPFLVESNHTRKPYLPVAKETVKQFQQIVAAQFADLLWNG